MQHTLHDVVARLHLDAIEIELESLREAFGDVAEESKAINSPQVGAHS